MKNIFGFWVGHVIASSCLLVYLSVSAVAWLFLLKIYPFVPTLLFVAINIGIFVPFYHFYVKVSVKMWKKSLPEGTWFSYFFSYILLHFWTILFLIALQRGYMLMLQLAGASGLQGMMEEQLLLIQEGVLGDLSSYSPIFQLLVQILSRYPLKYVVYLDKIPVVLLFYVCLFLVGSCVMDLGRGHRLRVLKLEEEWGGGNA